MTDSKKLIKNTTIYAIGDIAPRLLSFISFPILTRYLLPADYGIINYVNTLNVFLLAAGFLCVNTYYLVHFYRYPDDVARKKLLGNLFSFVLILNTTILLIFLIFGNFFFHLAGSKVPFYPFIVIGLFTNFFNLFSVLPSALYRLLEKPLFLTILNILDAVLALVLMLILVIHYHFSAAGALSSNLIVNFIFVFIYLYKVKDHIIWNINLKQIKTVLKFSLPLVPGSIAYYLTTISDRILIDKFLNLTDLGIYGTASSIALILNIFSYGAYKAFEPYIFKNWGTDGFIPSFEKIRNGFMFVLLIGVLCLSVFSKEFFAIMTGAKFHIAYWYLPMIITGVFSTALNMLYGTIVTAMGKTKINSLINMGGAAISVGLNVIFLPRFGLITAAIVSSFAMTSMLFCSILYTRLKVELFKPILSVLISALTIYILVYVINIQSFIVSIALKGCVLLAIIPLLSWILSVDMMRFFKKLFAKKEIA